MRLLVGSPPETAFENDSTVPVIADISAQTYDSALDLSSVSRQVFRRSPRPRTYLGLDPHHGAVA